MLKDAVYQGLHGPLSIEAIRAHIEQHPALTLHGIVENVNGSVRIQVLRHAMRAVQTLLYEPDEGGTLLRLVAVSLLGAG
jgi:hypothetical protein